MGSGYVKTGLVVQVFSQNTTVISNKKSSTLFKLIYLIIKIEKFKCINESYVHK